MKRSFRNDDKAATSILEFMLSFIIAAGIFSIFVMNFNSLFMAGPRNVVMTNQFVDVGNDVSTKIIDTYLVIPDDGMVATYFDVPDLAGGQPYIITVTNLSEDRDVMVSSTSGDVNVHITLNGANSTIPINGTTYSTSNIHGIVYHSIGVHT
jgi:hypothetical protein